jgi:hypothetical protein
VLGIWCFFPTPTSLLNPFSPSLNYFDAGWNCPKPCVVNAGDGKPLI